VKSVSCDHATGSYQDSLIGVVGSDTGEFNSEDFLWKGAIGNLSNSIKLLISKITHCIPFYWFLTVFSTSGKDTTDFGNMFLLIL
jgi:hypothetical protein